MQRTDFPLPSTWDRAGLAAVGFEGFRPLVSIEAHGVTSGKGIYAVLRPYPDAPCRFGLTNPLGAYPPEDLERRWILGAPIVYIGKAGGAGGLKQRIVPYGRKSSSHSGGRSVWQLADADDLLICWTETPGMDPRRVEKDYLQDFKRVHGAQPFANLA